MIHDSLLACSLLPFSLKRPYPVLVPADHNQHSLGPRTLTFSQNLIKSFRFIAIDGLGLRS